MKCPSCGCSKRAVTWVTYTFQYGNAKLTYTTPPRTCPLCGEEWCNFSIESINKQEAIDIHLLPTIIDDAWVVAAKKVAKCAEAYNIYQVVAIMKSYKVPIEEMDEWCQQARMEYPSLFRAIMFSCPICGNCFMTETEAISLQHRLFEDCLALALVQGTYYESTRLV